MPSIKVKKHHRIKYKNMQIYMSQLKAAADDDYIYIYRLFVLIYWLSIICNNVETLLKYVNNLFIFD